MRICAATVALVLESMLDAQLREFGLSISVMEMKERLILELYDVKKGKAVLGLSEEISASREDLKRTIRFFRFEVNRELSHRKYTRSAA